MFGPSKLTSLRERKKILLAESHLNREHFVATVKEIKHGFGHTKQQLTQVSSMATIATKLFTTLSSARRFFSNSQVNGKKSWLGLLVDGVTAGTSLWHLLRSQKRKEEVFKQQAHKRNF
jgi:hypothetical protein